MKTACGVIKNQASDRQKKKMWLLFTQSQKAILKSFSLFAATSVFILQNDLPLRSLLAAGRPSLAVPVAGQVGLVSDPRPDQPSVLGSVPPLSGLQCLLR